MKTDFLKSLIKEAVREAIQEELKDIILEAVKSPKTIVSETVRPQITSHPNLSSNTQRDLRSMIGSEFNATFAANSSHAQPSFNPSPAINTVGEGSALPGGDVSLDQIMGLMK